MRFINFSGPSGSRLRPVVPIRLSKYKRASMGSLRGRLHSPESLLDHNTRQTFRREREFILTEFNYCALCLDPP
jgi:hypothetical protein